MRRSEVTLAARQSSVSLRQRKWLLRSCDLQRDKNRGDVMADAAGRTRDLWRQIRGTETGLQGGVEQGFAGPAPRL